MSSINLLRNPKNSVFKILIVKYFYNCDINFVVVNLELGISTKFVTTLDAHLALQKRESRFLKNKQNLYMPIIILNSSRMKIEKKMKLFIKSKLYLWSLHEIQWNFYLSETNVKYIMFISVLYHVFLTENICHELIEGNKNISISIIDHTTLRLRTLFTWRHNIFWQH